MTFPGLIDCHVHFREPGLTHKETMATGAAAARAGGVLTVCEMPNTIPPTVTIEALAEKVRIGRRVSSFVESCRRHDSTNAHTSVSASVDIRFFFGATESRHLIALRKLWQEVNPALAELKKKCCGVKVYFDHSTGDQGASQDVLEETFALCGALDIPLVAHCEDPEINAEASNMIIGAGSRGSSTPATDVSLHSLMRPVASEIRAIEQAIDLARRQNAPLHIAHLSTGGGLDLVRKAKAEGLRVTCEVAPHHLFLTVDDYETLGTLGKMNPPLRTREERDALWAGVADGTVDCIATDHAPHTLEEKRSGDPLKAPSGVPGVETMLPLLLTVAAGKWPSPQGLLTTHHSLLTTDIRRLCFDNPNRIFRLEAPADDVLTIDPDAEWTIEAKHLHSKCGWTPYEGWKVVGKIGMVQS